MANPKCWAGRVTGIPCDLGGGRFGVLKVLNRKQPCDVQYDCVDFSFGLKKAKKRRRKRRRARA